MKTIDAKSKDLRALNSTLKDSVNGVPVTVKNAAHISGLAAGFKHGEIIIESDVGDYVGVLNAGATIRVTKSAGKYVGDNMTERSDRHRRQCRLWRRPVLLRRHGGRARQRRQLHRHHEQGRHHYCERQRG